MRACGTWLSSRSEVLTRILPEADRRNLCHAFHVVEHVKDRMPQGNIDHRKLARGQRLSDLRLPDVPRVLAPEIIDPEKSTLDEIVVQMRRILRIQIQRADLLHDDDPTPVQLVVAEVDDRVVVPAARIAAHRRLRQLGESVGQVLVGLRVVGRPVSADALRMPLAHGAAVLERAVVRRIGWQAIRGPAEASELRGGRGGEADRDEQSAPRSPHDAVRGGGCRTCARRQFTLFLPQVHGHGIRVTNRDVLAERAESRERAWVLCGLESAPMSFTSQVLS